MTVIDDFQNGLRPRINKLVNAVEVLAPLHDVISNDDKPLWEQLQSDIAKLSTYLDQAPTVLRPLLNSLGIFWSVRLDFMRLVAPIPSMVDLINEDYQPQMTEEQKSILAEIRIGCQDLSHWMAEFATQYDAQLKANGDS